MKIVSTCTSCKTETRIKTLATTRPDLIKDKGEEIKVNCSSCGNNEKHHVNDFKAIPNHIYTIVAAIISLVLSIALLFVVGIVGTVSIIIPILVWKQQASAVSAFNNYRTRR